MAKAAVGDKKLLVSSRFVSDVLVYDFFWLSDSGSMLIWTFIANKSLSEVASEFLLVFWFISAISVFTLEILRDGIKSLSLISEKLSLKKPLLKV